jgi:hypothetical protein
MTDDIIGDGGEIELPSEPYQEMLHELRQHHGDEIDAYLLELVRDGVHESYKELDGE